MDKRYITTKGAAEFLGISVSTLRNWDKAGKLAALRHPTNRYRLYRFSELENFIKKTAKRNVRNTKLQLVDE